MAKRGAAAEAEADDTGSVESANERDMEALREAEKPAKREPEVDDEPPLEFAESGDDDDDGEPAQPAERARPTSNSARRGARYRELQERTERAEAAAAAQAQRLAALEQQLSQGVAQQPQGGPHQQLNEHLQRYDDDYARNQQEQMSLAEFYALREQQTQGRMADEEKQRFLARSRELQLQASEIAVGRATLLQQARAPQPVDPIVAVLRAEYHDVESNPAAKSYARAYWLAKRAAGAPEGLPLLKEALNYGREWLVNGAGQPPPPGGKAPKPSKDSQARFTGSAPGASPARAAPTAQTTGRAVLPDGLSMKEFEKMADKMYPHIKDDAQRRTRYYRDCVEPEMRKGE